MMLVTAAYLEDVLDTPGNEVFLLLKLNGLPERDI